MGSNSILMEPYVNIVHLFWLWIQICSHSVVICHDSPFLYFYFQIRKVPECKVTQYTKLTFREWCSCWMEFIRILSCPVMVTCEQFIGNIWNCLLRLQKTPAELQIIVSVPLNSWLMAIFVGLKINLTIHCIVGFGELCEAASWQTDHLGIWVMDWWCLKLQVVLCPALKIYYQIL